MDVRVLGAASEVGRSGFLVKCDRTNILLDYGVMFAKRRDDPPLYPLHIKPKDVDAAIITHAHLDHSGCVPSLFIGGNTHVYETGKDGGTVGLDGWHCADGECGRLQDPCNGKLE